MKWRDRQQMSQREVVESANELLLIVLMVAQLLRVQHHDLPERLRRQAEVRRAQRHFASREQFAALMVAEDARAEVAQLWEMWNRAEA
jgi:uncharacterized membrane protein